MIVFNEAFYFDLPSSKHHRLDNVEHRGQSTGLRHRQSQLADTSVEILLLDWNRSSKEDIVGRLVIGPFDYPSTQESSNPTANGEEPKKGEWSTMTSEQRQQLNGTQNEASTALLMHAIAHDRQVAVWYKLTE